MNPTWIVARRSPDGAWAVGPPMTSQRAEEYAAHLEAQGFQAVGLDLDALDLGPAPSVETPETAIVDPEVVADSEPDVPAVEYHRPARPHWRWAWSPSRQEYRRAWIEPQRWTA